MGTTMNFLHRLRQHLTRVPIPATTVAEVPQTTEQQPNPGGEPVAFDQVERLTGSGASLETLLEMNRVQGW